MLFVEMWTKKLFQIKPEGNKERIAFYINPITDINLLENELTELKKVNKDPDLILKNKDIHYLSLFKMELDFFNETHSHYNKTDCIINNNNVIKLTPDFKKYSNQIKKELRKIIKVLENQHP